MRWVNRTLIAGGLLSTVVALAAAGQDGTSAPQQRGDRVIVRPQIEIVQGDRPRLGVALRDVDEASATERKLAAPEGAIVERVDDESPAAKAGVKAGDVIAAFDGERVRSVRHLQRLVGETPAGRPVKVVLVRDGRKMEVTVTLTPVAGAGEPGSEGGQFEQLEQELGRLRGLPRMDRFEWWSDDQDRGGGPRFNRQAPSPRFPLNQWSSGAGRLGVTVQSLSPQLGEYFGAKDGLLVASVSQGSPAARAGVKAGDVITTANGKAMSDPGDLVQAVRRQPDGEELSLGIVRDRKPITVKVKLLGATKAKPI
jgi:serine protease Do